MAQVSYHEAVDARSRLRSERTAKPVLAHILIKEGENGGHVIEHHFRNAAGPYVEPKSYPFGASEGKKAAAHLKEHIGLDVGSTTSTGEGKSGTRADQA
jgi:hypothetical protein